MRQIVSKSAQVLYGEKRVNLRAGIAQRVGTGLRPGKLRKKALCEDNKDSELARGVGEVGRIRRAVQFTVDSGALQGPAGRGSFIN